MNELTLRQQETLNTFEYILRDTGISLEYDEYDVWGDNGEGETYSARGILDMVVTRLEKWDKTMDKFVDEIRDEFITDIPYDLVYKTMMDSDLSFGITVEELSKIYK